MSPTEIWLRLMLIPAFSGEKCLKIAHFLLNCSVIDDDALTASGLNTKSRRLFSSLTAKQREASLEWLENPGHLLLTADSPDYPEPLRATAHFPAALFVAGDPKVLSKEAG